MNLERIGGVGDASEAVQKRWDDGVRVDVTNATAGGVRERDPFMEVGKIPSLQQEGGRKFVEELGVVDRLHVDKVKNVVRIDCTIWAIIDEGLDSRQEGRCLFALSLKAGVLTSCAFRLLQFVQEAWPSRETSSFDSTLSIGMYSYPPRGLVKVVPLPRVMLSACLLGGNRPCKSAIQESKMTPPSSPASARTLIWLWFAALKSIPWMNLAPFGLR